MIREVPILFSDAMVRAIISSRKTQTRRLAWLRYPKPDNPSLRTRVIDGERYRASQWQKVRAGDRLWVKEAWRALDETQTFYRADYSEKRKLAWKPSLFMPRARSRLTLTVEWTRMEPLQSISERDAIDEGCLSISEYARLWNSLHGTDAWEANPEVVVISFEILRSHSSV